MDQYEYKIISHPSEEAYSIKGSKFIAYAYHIEKIEQVQVHLDEIRKLHHKARHHCYAYRIGLDGNVFRANDDGEPSSTAGKPILGQISSFGLTDTLIIVVRYFGGTKLGASGLISAYKTSAKLALENATIITKQVTSELVIKTDHQHIGILMSTAKNLGFQLGEVNYVPSPSIVLKAPLRNLEEHLVLLKSRTLNIPIEKARVLLPSDVFHILED